MAIVDHILDTVTAVVAAVAGWLAHRVHEMDKRISVHDVKIRALEDDAKEREAKIDRLVRDVSDIKTNVEVIKATITRQ